MGYDSRIYVVEKHTNSITLPVVIDDVNYGNRVWSQVIASMEMGKCPIVANFMRCQPETDSYIYADDGNTMIVTDDYDKIMTECSIDELIKVVEKEIYSGNDYRRLSPLYGLLKAFKANQWNEIRVLHYGH